MSSSKHMRTPLVSVLMPVHNAERYLREAVESIINQTFSAIEILALDDFSSDGSPDILKSYADLRIRYIRNSRNLGIAKTLNKGISLARGRYIARMDADDISLPDRIAEQVDFMEANRQTAVCGTWVQYIGRDVAMLEDNLLKDPCDPEEIRCSFLFNCVLKHPSVMIRKDVLEREGYAYNDRINRAEDYELWVRVSQKYDLANLAKVLLKYRLHRDKVSQVHQQKNFEQADKIRESLLLGLGLKPSRRELALHHELCRRFRTDFPLDLLDDSRRWLNRISEQNNVANVYDKAVLRDIINRRWELINKSSLLSQGK